MKQKQKIKFKVKFKNNLRDKINNVNTVPKINNSWAHIASIIMSICYRLLEITWRKIAIFSPSYSS